MHRIRVVILIVALLAVCLVSPCRAALPEEPKTLQNSLGMKFVLIPAGEFMMGNEDSVAALLKEFPDAKKEWIASAERRHPVRITKPFYLGVAAVTRSQFAKFVSAVSFKTDAETDGLGGWGYDAVEKDFAQKPEFTWKNTGFVQADDHPVVNVSWDDAQAFSDWLAKKEGKKYRLPTEAEWEYACRAGTTSRYLHGDDPEGLAAAANTWDALTKEKFPGSANQLKRKDGYVFTAPVEAFRPNKFGLYDMNGNVRNWCADWYDEDYYTTSPTTDPQGPEDGTFRVNRGGSWGDSAVYCRSANRNAHTPDDRSDELGFRLVLIP